MHALVGKSGFSKAQGLRETGSVPMFPGTYLVSPLVDHF